MLQDFIVEYLRVLLESANFPVEDRQRIVEKFMKVLLLRVAKRLDGDLSLEDKQLLEQTRTGDEKHREEAERQLMEDECKKNLITEAFFQETEKLITEMNETFLGAASEQTKERFVQQLRVLLQR